MNHTSPSVIFVGPQRTGSSWLYEYFKQRDDICINEKVKELNFFNSNFGKGLNWYEAFFDCDRNTQKTLEICTTYFNSIEAPKRIHNVLGEVTIIVILRNPLERSISLFNHLKRYGKIDSKLSFNQAFFENKHLHEASNYSSFLTIWKQVFEDKLNIVYYDDMVNNIESYVASVCTIVGIPYQNIKMPERINASVTPKSFFISKVASQINRFLRKNDIFFISNFLKGIGLKKIILGNKRKAGKSNTNLKIKRHFLQEISALENLLDEDFSHWKESL